MNVLKLKELRIQANLTQFEVSEKMRITQSHYSRWENGNRSPNSKQILELCEVFNCSPNDLFGYKER